MNKKAKSAVAAAVLLATFTTNALSVENQPINVAEQIEKSFVPIKQVQMDSTFAKSATVDAIINVKREVSRVKNRVYYPSNTPKNENPLSGKPINHSKREDSVDAKMDRLMKDGKIKQSNFPKTGKNVEQKLTVADVRNMLFPGKPSNLLTTKEKKEVLKQYRFFSKMTIKVKLSDKVAPRKGVNIPDNWIPKINKMGEVYFVKTGGHKIDVTSVQRSPLKQASAMRNNIERYGQKTVKKTYRNKRAFDQIDAARRANPNNPQKADATMARVIENQMKRGVFISRHLKNGAIDVGRKTNEPALREAVRTAGGRYFFEKDHYHIDLNPNG